MVVGCISFRSFNGWIVPCGTTWSAMSYHVTQCSHAFVDTLEGVLEKLFR